MYMISLHCVFLSCFGPVPCKHQRESNRVLWSTTYSSGSSSAATNSPAAAHFPDEAYSVPESESIKSDRSTA